MHLPESLLKTAESLTPETLWQTAAVLGNLWYHAQPNRHALAEQQLRTSITEIEPLLAHRIVKRMFHHLAAIPLEVLAATLTPRTTSNDRTIDLGPAGTMTVFARHHLQKVLKQGRGALVMSAHLGNFELGLHAEALAGLPLSVVTKTLSNSKVDQMWRDLRTQSGLEIIEDDNSLKHILKALHRGRAVVMALDQHANRMHAVQTSFFNQPAWTHRGMALLSARSRTPVVPVFAQRRSPGRHILRYMTPIPFERDQRSIREALAHNTNRYTQLIESAVLANPEQWTWLHRRWK